MDANDKYWFFDRLDWDYVDACFQARWEAHVCLSQELRKGPSKEFARLAVGEVDPAANYSANEHGLGPKILQSNPNAEKRLWDLANAFLALKTARDVPSTVQAAGLSYCRVGVGSEISSVLRPDVFWVCNVRTLWTWILTRPRTVKEANEELRLYRAQSEESEIYWPTWKDLHRNLGRPMRELVRASEAYASPPTEGVYLWADAICNVAYEAMAEKG